MTDIELILFLLKLLWDDCSDGDVPDENDWDKIREELIKRNVDPDEAMPY